MMQSVVVVVCKGFRVRPLAAHKQQQHAWFALHDGTRVYGEEPPMTSRPRRSSAVRASCDETAPAPAPAPAPPPAVASAAPEAAAAPAVVVAVVSSLGGAVAYTMFNSSPMCFLTNCSLWACSVARECKAWVRGDTGEAGDTGLRGEEARLLLRPNDPGLWGGDMLDAAAMACKWATWWCVPLPMPIAGWLPPPDAPAPSPPCASEGQLLVWPKWWAGATGGARLKCQATCASV